MADIAIATPANIRELDAVESRRVTMIASVAITRGQVVYRIASGATKGQAALARGNAVGTAKPVGIATEAAGIGQPFEALYLGRMVGFDGLTSLNAGVTLYLSAATAGAISDVIITGTGNVVAALGTVHTMTDVAGTPYVLFDISQSATPVAL